MSEIAIGLLETRLQKLAERVAALEALRASKPHSRRCSANGASFCFYPDGAQCEVCGWPAPAEKAEARTCTPGCGKMFGGAVQYCTDACCDAGHPLNPAPAVPKAEPERCSATGCGDVVGWGETARPWYCSDSCRIDADDPPAPESTPDVPGPVTQDSEISLDVVSHDMARTALIAPIRGDIIGRYISQRETYERMATMWMRDLDTAVAERNRLRTKAGRDGDILVGLREEKKGLESQLTEVTKEAEQLRAELARLRAAGSAGGSGQGEAVSSSLTRLRAAGWSVAVHNDYRLNGESRTFWLFTHPGGRWIKGEAATDAAALKLCEAAAAPAETKGGE